jgi:tetratricopeptide (TPR) repeat protein
MSIIHDALKKAEREREPRSAGLAFYQGVKPAPRRWRGIVVTSMLIGATTTVAIGAWRWLPPLGVWPTVGVTAPLPASLPGSSATADDRTTRPAVVAEPSPVMQSPRTPVGSTSEDIPLPGAAPTLASELPTSAEAAFEKARKAESKGQWEHAMQYYRQAIALDPTSIEAHNNLGHLYVRQRQIAAAIGAFQDALTLDPNYAMARNNLGSAYLLVGEETLAIQEFLAALRIDGTYVSPYYNLASLYAQRGDVGPSVAFLTKALAIEPAVLSWLLDDLDFDRIRAAPEFQQLRRQRHARR